MLCSRVNPTMPDRIRVAFVAPSLRILGGQAVQADRLLQAWRDDPDVDAWLVPVNPDPPLLLSSAHRIKYVRTVANELTYLPLLARELGRADVVHVFSASYTSFLLAPLPAMLASMPNPLNTSTRKREGTTFRSTFLIVLRAIADRFR